MVAGGDLVVGLVVFVIITVVQFVVIAKGAERVAEVAARFSLDAMPGKQLSIDSDLRSGLIDKDEARRRRKVLEIESKLHGALDGAMKFVKGDAIAGIIIVLVNIIGGLAVGVMQRGLTVGEAVRTYSVLTIGDGLVTQIPALLGAMAAGLIVTRTTDGESGGHLGDAVRLQLVSKPKVFLMTGALLLAMTFVPGFPWPVFAGLGLISGLTGVALDPVLRTRAQLRLQPLTAALRRSRPRRLDTAHTRAVEARPSPPLLLDLSGRGVHAIDEGKLTAALGLVLDGFEAELGLCLPRLAVRAREREEPCAWKLLAYEAPVGAGDLSEVDPIDSLALALHQALRRNLGLFLGIQEASGLLARASVDYPEVVKEAARALPVARVAEVLRRLVEEEVSLRNLRDILEALADAGQRDKDSVNLTEFTRVALRRQISHRHAPGGRLRALALSPELEAKLREALRTPAHGAPQLGLAPQDAALALNAFKAAVAQTRAAVVLTPIDLRRHVRKLIEPDLFDTAVLSFHELVPTLTLEIAGRVTLAAVAPALPEPAH
jgi:type III secretion protein V